MFNHHFRLLGALKDAFPHFSAERVQYLANKVTNKISPLKIDVYAVEVSARPFAPKFDKYYTHLEVKADSTIIYLRITVD